jgi:hypothetical protein
VRIGLTVVLPRGSAVILHALPIALLPLHLAMRVEPRRGDDGSTVEGLAEGFPDTRSAIDRTPARQPMRGVGALASAGFKLVAFAAAVQDGVEQARFGRPPDQPGAQLAEDRTVETRVGELSAQSRLPIDPTAHGLGSLAI